MIRTSRQTATIGDPATDAAVERLDARVDQARLPVGAVFDWAGDTDSLGTDDLPEIGQLLRVAEFPELFRVAGTRYGGDGVTTFMLPDTRAPQAIVTTGLIDETAWTAYTPGVQNAAGTSFVGAAIIDGHWRRWGSTVEARVYLVPAIDTGTAPGSADQWYITLPVNTIDTKAIIGSAFGYAKDADPTSASALQAIGVCRVPTSDPGRMQAYFNRDGFTHWLSGANPFDTSGLPSDQMYYELTIVYPMASVGGVGGLGGVMNARVVRAR